MCLICHVTLHETLLRGNAKDRWEILVVCHHREKCYDRKYCDSGHIMFSICYVTSRKYIFNKLWSYEH